MRPIQTLFENAGLTCGNHGYQSVARVSRGIAKLCGVDHHVALHGIAMNVILMVREILWVANAMVGESALPDLAFSPKDSPEFMRVAALDELDRVFDRHVFRGRQQKMNMFRHQHKGVQLVTVLSFVAVENLQQ